MKKPIAFIGFFAIGFIGYLTFSVLRRHYRLFRFPRIPSDYQVRPNETVVCSRPFDEIGYQNFYPLFKHTYIKTSEGPFGYHFCGPDSHICPERFGPLLAPDMPEYEKAKEPSRQECWLVSSDPAFKDCVFRKARERVGIYKYPSKYIAVVNNACSTFVDDVVERCRKEVVD